MIDVARLRADTPGVTHVNHLNNAGAALMPTPVIETLRGYIQAEATIGGYEAFRQALDETEDVYATVAELIGAKSHEIAIVDSATTAWDKVVYSLPHAEGDRILTTTTEYGSNWAAFIQLQSRFGVETIVVPDGPTGEMDIEALATMIDERTTLITLNHVPTNGGVVNPAAQVGRIAREHGVPFLLDACQSVGQMPIDVAEIGCDFLTSTSRKFLRGPRGIGFAYVNEQSLDGLSPVFVDNHSTMVTDRTITLRSDARRLETWEKSWANVLGFGVACRYAIDIGVDAIWERIRDLSATMRAGLGVLDGVHVLDRGTVKGAIVSFTVDGKEAIEVMDRLARQSINVSYSTINSAPYDMRMRGIDSLVRASVHAYNSEDEVQTFLDAVATMVE